MTLYVANGYVRDGFYKKDGGIRLIVIYKSYICRDVIIRNEKVFFIRHIGIVGWLSEEN